MKTPGSVYSTLTSGLGTDQPEVAEESVNNEDIPDNPEIVKLQVFKKINYSAKYLEQFTDFGRSYINDLN
jgi:hypothetical protein